MPFAAIAVAIFINALWGGNPIAVKIGLDVFPPFWSAFIRFAMGAACIAAWAFVAGLKLWPLPHEWGALLWLSAIFVIQIAVMNVGIDLSEGAIASVLIAMFPLFAAGFSHFYIPGDRLTPLRTAGLAVAFLGAAVVVVRDSGIGLPGSIGLGEVVVLLSAAMLGARMVITASLLRRMDTARVVFWQMIVSLPIFGLAAFTTETVAMERLGWAPVAGLLYQGVVIAGFGFVVSAMLYRRYEPSIIAGFGFVSPVTGVVLGVWLLGDVLTTNLLIGTGAVGLGLVMITFRRPGSGPARPQQRSTRGR